MSAKQSSPIAAKGSVSAAAQPSGSPAAESGRWIVFTVSALMLFACVWLTRVFLATELVAQWRTLTGLKAIAAVAVISGLLPAVVLGIVYGALIRAPAFRRALAVAAAACVLELGFASLSVPWWLFITWWVLPVECLVVLLVFPSAAWLGARLRSGRARTDHPMR